MAKKQTQKPVPLDMDGDVIPKELCNEGWSERRDGRVGHYIIDNEENIKALKCPNTKKWCTGVDGIEHVFNCYGCPEFDKWRKESIKDSSNNFKKADEGKLQWSLMPFEQLEDVVRVLMNGAKKYARDNWKKCDDINRYKDALMRHVVSYIKGEKNDPEDNLSHLAHAMCNCLFLMYFDKRENKTLLEQFDELKRGDK